MLLARRLLWVLVSLMSARKEVVPDILWGSACRGCIKSGRYVVV
jgi:hypothetical protein